MIQVAEVRFVFLLVVAVTVPACGGWHLRGHGPSQLPFTSAYIKSANAPVVSSAVRKELQQRGITLAQKRVDADVVVELAAENFDRRVLSVDPRSGKVREIELGLQTYFTVRDKDGKLLVPNEAVSWQLDYVFDEDSLLATVEQDSVVRRDLAETAATTLMLRLQAVRPPPSK